MSVAVPRRQLFIDGDWREPLRGKRIPVINPATEESIGDIPAATVEDVELAVDAARRALTRDGGKGWSRASGAFRANYLRAIASKITERKSELAMLEALDCGKPLEEAEGDVDAVADCFIYYAELGESLDRNKNNPIPLPMEAFNCHVIKEPIGVVGLITPCLVNVRCLWTCWMDLLEGELELLDLLDGELELLDLLDGELILLDGEMELMEMKIGRELMEMKP